MNFCRFYNKTRIWIDDKLIDMSVPSGEAYRPVPKINIIIGIVILIWILLYQIIVYPLALLIILPQWIYENTNSRCDLEEK